MVKADMIHLILSPVIANVKVAHGMFELILSAPSIACNAKPGQFVNLQISSSLGYRIHEDYMIDTLSKDIITPYPLLKRPFSIHDVYGDGKVSLLIKIVGRGTRRLSFLEKGDEVKLLGPLGNGFCIESDKKISILVGGGIGIAPLFFLARSLSSKGKKVFLFLGFYDRMHIPKKVLELSSNLIPYELRIATEEKCEDLFHGKITDLLAQFLDESNFREEMEIFSCGPWNMMREVSKLGEKFSIPHQVLLEERMGCGIGACMGCVHRTKEGNYRRVCTEGPVFRAENIF